MNIPTLLTNWSFEPSVLLGLVLAGGLYALGLRYSAPRGLLPHHRWWHTTAFYAGLLVVLIALESPLDALVDQFFWAHMLQHELLTLAAAPLLVFGAPLMPVWRAVPLGARRVTLGGVFGRPGVSRIVKGLGRALSTPLLAWLLFVGVFTAWHLPWLYDLALDQPPVHILEHVLFLATAVLFWAQVIPSRPLHLRLNYLWRAIYIGTSAMASNLLAAVYMYSVAPIYPYYAALHRPAGMMPALVDQHIAGAVMDVPGTILFFVAILALIALWLREDERASAAETGTPPSDESWAPVGVSAPAEARAGARP
jgi:putative membrane protein